jgi:hypothetical protein
LCNPQVVLNIDVVQRLAKERSNRVAILVLEILMGTGIDFDTHRILASVPPVRQHKFRVCCVFTTQKNGPVERLAHGFAMVRWSGYLNL